MNKNNNNNPKLSLPGLKELWDPDNHKAVSWMKNCATSMTSPQDLAYHQTVLRYISIFRE